MGRGRSGIKSTPAKIDLNDFVPVGVLLNQGPQALQKILDSLNEEELRRVIKDNRWDPSKMTRKMKTLNALKDFIMNRARQRASQGDAFRFYGK